MGETMKAYRIVEWQHAPELTEAPVPVLRVESPDGMELRAVMFGYACHNTTLSFFQYCGDYAGFAQQELEAAHPGMTALFLMGCGGDQNPYPRGTIEHCRTQVLGGQVYTCTRCATVRYSYHSCRKRHCPTCQHDQAQT